MAENLGSFLDLAMFLALCLLIFTGLPIVFVLTGCAVLFGALGILLGVFDPALIGALPHRVFGTMTSDVLVAIPLFVFMGLMLERSKIAEDLLEAMGRLFGRVNGGLAISVTLVGALLAASTGIVGATVVTMGLIALPVMMKRGYDPAFACGSICAAGTLGQIIPPSTVMVVLGEVLSSAHQQAQFAAGRFSGETVSVGQLFAGSIVPGVLLAALYALYQVILCRLRPNMGPALPQEERGAVGGTEIAGALLPPIVLIVAVLGSIIGGIATPTEAAGVGAVGAILLAGLKLERARPWPIYLAVGGAVLLAICGASFDLRLGRQTMPLPDGIALIAASIGALFLLAGLAVALRRSFRAKVLGAAGHSTMTLSAMIFATLIGATAFSLVFRGLGGEEMMHHALSQLPGGKWGALLVVMAVIFVLGFPLDFVEIVIIVVPIVGPILLRMDVDPIWLGVLIALNLQTSFLTPPFGPTLFYLQGVAPPSVTARDIYRGVAPFVVLQLVGLGLVLAFPALATWLPSLLFDR